MEDKIPPKPNAITISLPYFVPLTNSSEKKRRRKNGFSDDYRLLKPYSRSHDIKGH